MKLILIASALLHLSWAASIADVACPDSCTCQLEENNLQVSCVSYEFIKKLLPKQEAAIAELRINNASLVNVDLKLKYLKNLRVLDLSRNEISTLPSQFPYLPKLEILNLSSNSLKEVEFSDLPKNLQVVDLSNNSIANFPKDWANLKQLRVIQLDENPINCDCDNLEVHEHLVKEAVLKSQALTCSTPLELQRLSLSSVNCSIIQELLNSMLGDETGSGVDEFENETESNSFGEDDEILKVDPLSNPTEENSKNEENLEEHDFEGSGEEGSGDEGSGIIPIEPIPVSPKACHFNCSTPQPIGLENEKDASPPPSIHEQAKILFEDILQPEKVDPVEAELPQPTEKELVVKEEPSDFSNPGDKYTINTEVVTFPTNDTVLGEMERASLQTTDNKSVYIVVGLVMAFIALLLIYYVNKKRQQKRKNNRKRNNLNENGYGQELKPLGKPEPVKPVEQANIKLPEQAPLLNGNGKLKEANGFKPSSIDGSQESDDLDEVELRQHDLEESLAPQPERVTIKAAELLDSVPKTPLFIHRQLNSDGEIVTTTVNSG